MLTDAKTTQLILFKLSSLLAPFKQGREDSSCLMSFMSHAWVKRNELKGPAQLPFPAAGGSAFKRQPTSASSFTVRFEPGNGIECGMRREVGFDTVVAAEAPREGIEHRGQGGRLIVHDQNGGSLERGSITFVGRVTGSQAKGCRLITAVAVPAPVPAITVLVPDFSRVAIPR